MVLEGNLAGNQAAGSLERIRIACSRSTQASQQTSKKTTPLAEATAQLAPAVPGQRALHAFLQTYLPSPAVGQPCRAITKVGPVRNSSALVTAFGDLRCLYVQ